MTSRTSVPLQHPSPSPVPCAPRVQSPDVATPHPSQHHGSHSVRPAADPTDDIVVVSAWDSAARRPACGASAGRVWVDAALLTELRACCARERRKVNSCARMPNVSTASDQRTGASAWGHSFSQRSLVGPARSRRSCATIASCHEASRAPSAAASSVPIPEPRILYGFMSHLPSLRRSRLTTCSARSWPAGTLGILDAGLRAAFHLVAGDFIS